MKQKCIYVAFSNQKGGVGKSAFTTLVASHLHYAGGKTVAVMDCDYPQHSIHAMRKREKEMVKNNRPCEEMVARQLAATATSAYPVVTVRPADAVRAANELFREKETPVDVVFFDLPGTVRSDGVLKTMMNLDYIFCPIIADHFVMQSALAFAVAVRDYREQNPGAPLKGVFLFWNQLIHNEKKALYEHYNSIILHSNLNLLKTEIPLAVRYKREMSADGQPLFRSTLLPAHSELLKGSRLDLLVKEICQIINI